MSIVKSLQFALSRTRWTYNSTACGMIRGKPFSAAAPLETQFSVTEGGKQLRAVWSSSEGKTEPSTYHAVWLRHGCQCPRCISKYNQLLLESHELDTNVKISEVKLAGEACSGRQRKHLCLKNSIDGDIKIKWSCGHEGYIDLDWLRRNSYSHHALEYRRKGIRPQLQKQVVLLEASKVILPEMDSKELENDRGVLRWLKIVAEHGMCLLTGVPCTKEAGFEITGKISPYLQDTYYGGICEVKVAKSPNNVAYDSHKLETHMDAPQYESQPGLSLFQCVRFDECAEGGESIVVDLLAVMEKLRVTHPHHFDTLVRVPGTFHRIHYQRDFPVHMIYRSPHIHLNAHGEIVKLRWCPHNQSPPLIPEEDVVPYYEAVRCVGKLVNENQEFQVSQRFVPGDVLTINNHRVLHGRNAIKLNGGERHLNSFQINIDEFKSRLQLLCAKYDPDYEVKNVFNHDFSFSSVA